MIYIATLPVAINAVNITRVNNGIVCANLRDTNSQYSFFRTDVLLKIAVNSGGVGITPPNFWLNAPILAVMIRLISALIATAYWVTASFIGLITHARALTANLNVAVSWLPNAALDISLIAASPNSTTISNSFHIFVIPVTSAVASIINGRDAAVVVATDAAIVAADEATPAPHPAACPTTLAAAAAASHIFFKNIFAHSEMRPTWPVTHPINSSNWSRIPPPTIFPPFIFWSPSSSLSADVAVCVKSPIVNLCSISNNCMTSGPHCWSVSSAFLHAVVALLILFLHKPSFFLSPLTIGQSSNTLT